MLPCTITTDSEANSDAARAYATEFSDGSLGIMVTHQSETNATRVTVSGVAAGVKRQAAFFGKKAVANVWILHASSKLNHQRQATGQCVCVCVCATLEFEGARRTGSPCLDRNAELGVWGQG